MTTSRSLIALPPPCLYSQVSLEAAIARRRSIGPYAEAELTVEEIGQLLWAAHTIVSVHKNKGTNGSTRLILYVCGADGVWRYHPQEHCLTRHLARDVRRELADAAQNRWFIAQAPCVLSISGVLRHDAERCREWWRLRRLPVEAGRAVERMLLQAVALGLASVPVGEFDRAQARTIMILSRQEEPLCLLPVGRPVQGD
jgi:nitroreductase